MDDPIRGFTVEEYFRLTSGTIYEIRAALMSAMGYGELAKAAWTRPILPFRMLQKR